VSKRAAAVAVIAALVIGAVIGIVWHEPKSMALPDDIRTWVGFVIVIIGAGVALWQLDMQRRQLADQQDVLKGEVERNRKRDELLDTQLRESEQRALAIERQQAEEIDFRRSSFNTTVPGSNPNATYRAHAAEIVNDSRRPIRNAACRIEPEPGDSLQVTDRVGSYVGAPVAMSSSVSARTFLDLSDGTHIPLIRAGETAAFAFAVDAAEHPKARITARFTDDAGLYWQIDPDLHLEKLDNRDDW
jgi:hypothetical protein